MVRHAGDAKAAHGDLLHCSGVAIAHRWHDVAGHLLRRLRGGGSLRRCRWIPGGNLVGGNLVGRNGTGVLRPRCSASQSQRQRCREANSPHDTFPRSHHLSIDGTPRRTGAHQLRDSKPPMIRQLLPVDACHHSQDTPLPDQRKGRFGHEKPAHGGPGQLLAGPAKTGLRHGPHLRTTAPRQASANRCTAPGMARDPRPAPARRARQLDGCHEQERSRGDRLIHCRARTTPAAPARRHRPARRATVSR